MPDIDPDQSFGPPGQFINPAYATPNQVAMLRALATKNLTQQPEAKSWAGVLGGLAQTWGGLQQMDRANTAEKQSLQQSQDAMVGNGQQGGNGLLGGAPPNGGGGGSIADSYGPGIAKVESGGNYGAVGPKTRNGDHGYGKYQVMGKNIPGWTQEVLGQSLTPQQFLANPQAQEAVFKAKFNQYGSQTGSPQDAASMWFSGKPMAQALASGNKADVNGMRPSAYVQAALRGGGQPVQMAQNAMGPFAGMSSSQAAFNTLNPWNQGNHEMVRGMYSPQFMGGPGGQGNLVVPAQGGGATNVVQGAMPNSTGTADVSVPGVTTMGPRGPTGNQFAIPGGGAGGAGAPAGTAPPASTGPLPPVVDQLAAQGRGYGAKTRELQSATDTINGYKTDGIEAGNKLALLDGFKALGQSIESGASTQLLAFLANKGFPITEDTPTARMQTYQRLAQELGVQGDIPSLAINKEARANLANSIENQLIFRRDRGLMSQDETLGNPQERSKYIATHLKPPQFLTQEQQLQAGGGAPGKAGAAPVGTPSQTSGQAVAAMSQADKDGSRAAAAAAIKAGKNRDGVLAKLKAHGIDTSGL